MAFPVAEVWTVSGTLNKGNVAFSEGKVYAYNYKNGEFSQIAESGISADGAFTLTFSRWNFQEGDETLEYPTLQIRVYDYQGNLLWTSGTYNQPDSALNIGAIDILKPAGQNGDCSVFGAVKNEQGNILSGLKVVAYCLHFEETVVATSTTRRLKKIELGTIETDADGKYKIRYNSTLLPTGLLLDSKEDYGKDKVSLYAEVFELINGSYKSLAIEHLVFNGKTDQEINFVLKSQQKTFRCEFEKLDDLLYIYQEAVFTEYGGSSLTEKIAAITTFLKSNTAFPLVAGRERLTESIVHAYFVAYGLYYQLLNRYNTANTTEKYESLQENEEKRYWCEVFFALALREEISTLYQITKQKPTSLQKALFGAVSDGLICIDTNKFLELWPVVAESKAVQEMEVKSLEAEKVRLEEKKAAKQNTSKMQKAMHLVSAAEKKYQKLMEKVAKIQETVEKVRNIASATFKIPDFKYGSVVNAFGGPRFDIESLGGTKLAENLVSAAESYAARFAQRQLDAAKTKLQAELERRKKEWLLEDEEADAEVVEVEKQEVVNEIKTQQVEKKYKNIENEILRSEQVYEVLSEKFTNNDLYIWLEKELGKVFKQYVNLLIDVAKMAEKAYHFEIPNDTNNKPYIQTDYWDSFYKGLLAPERILLDLRRMEKAYLEKDCHGMEIIRPIAIFKNLTTPTEIPQKVTVEKTDGKNEYLITIQPGLFNADFEGHVNRRIRDVRLQIISGNFNEEFANVNAELALTSDTLFSRIYATSMALSDVGKFDFSFVDDRYSSFEGASLDEITEWTLRLSNIDCLDKINAKVILLISYTSTRN